MSNFHENPSGGIRVFPCGQTDRHDEAVILQKNEPKNSSHDMTNTSNMT